LGTDGGINILNTKTGEFTFYKTDPNNPNSISHNEVMEIYKSKSEPGIFWIGTYGGGLNRFDLNKKSFTHFKEHHGLANNVVYGIMEDNEGNLWISTNRGLSKFNPKTLVFKNYNRRDGIQDNEFNWQAHCKSRDGKMYFGGINGFTTFIPSDIQSNPFIPSVAITDLQVSNRTIHIEEIVNGNMILKESISQTKQITLSHMENDFTITLSALHYAYPKDNQYKCKLEGYDKVWKSLGKNPKATYNNIPPGNYVFRYKASNHDNVWIKEGNSLKIIINPSVGIIIRRYSYLIFLVLTIAGIISILTIRIRKKTSNVLRIKHLPPKDLENTINFFSKYKISKREQEIIELIFQGKNSTQMADQFYISQHTVKNHIYNIYQKVGVKNRVQLINFISQFQKKNK
jgi:DNA-binding CsgD family transcriptional regulator